MAFMTWSDEYRVGVALIDQEHKELVGLINELHDSAGGISRPALTEMLDKLVAHTVEHFRHEEEYFEPGYRQADAHRTMHERMKARVMDFRGQIGRKDDGVLAAELLKYLKEGLGHHIRGEDKNLGVYLNGKGIA